MDVPEKYYNILQGYPYKPIKTEEDVKELLDTINSDDPLIYAINVLYYFSEYADIDSANTYDMLSTLIFDRILNR